MNRRWVVGTIVLTSLFLAVVIYEWDKARKMEVPPIDIDLIR